MEAHPRRRTPAISSRRRWRSPTTFATRSGGSSRRAWARWRRRPPSSAAWAARRSAATWRRPRSAIASREPLLTVRGYELPSWAPHDSPVLCSSYSGQHRGDPRLLRGRRGARRAGASSPPPAGSWPKRRAATRCRWSDCRRGLQPRAAVGYMFAVRRRGRRAARAPPRRSTPRSTPPPPSSRTAARRSCERSAELADALEGAAVVVYGSGLTDAVAYRWKLPAQRERQAAGLPARAAGGRPQRDRRLAGGR